MKQIVYLWCLFMLFDFRECNTVGEPNWFWQCNGEDTSCTRTQNTNQTQLYFESLDLCRLICGTAPLWPRIKGIKTIGVDVIQVHPSQIQFMYADEKDTTEMKKYLLGIEEIFMEKLYKYCGAPCKIMSDTSVTISMQVNSTDMALKWSTDESYSLNVTRREFPASETRVFLKIVIKAETVFGARHALETLTQLFASYETTNRNTNEINHGLVMITEAFIQDGPVYKHRGLLLDTARNFLPIETIKTQIVAMGASKMNVFHWHITDSQSWGLEVPSVPQFTEYGAYSKSKIYTQKDVKELIQFALLHGVRVIIELDGPSHASFGWQWGPKYNLGDLAVCVNKQPWQKYCIQPPCGQLNPVNPNLYMILGKLYKDVINLQPNQEAIHMGGDEVFIPCWNSSAEIVNFIKTYSQYPSEQDFIKLWAMFQSNATEMYDKQMGHNDSKIILWTSHLTDPSHIENYLGNNKYVIQTWVPSKNPLPGNLLKKGYQLIISTKNAWYLDHGFWGINPYYTWQKVYKNRISRHENVLGGEVCMWSEYVDKEGISSRIWPRAAAAAERLWSDPRETNMNVILPRLLRHRERLIRLGVQADVITPEWCSVNEGQCANYFASF